MRKSFVEFLVLVKESRNWIFFITFVFVLGIVAGVIISLVNPDITRGVFRDYGSSLQKIASSSGFGTALFIFERNASILIFSMALNFLGLVPLAVAYVNGSVFGMIFGYREIYSSFSILKILVLILPHGVVEITTTLIGLGLAFKTGLHWLFVKKGRRKTFLLDFQNLAKASVFIVAFLAVAALIEAFITPALSCLAFKICFS